MANRDGKQSLDMFNIYDRPVYITFLQAMFLPSLTNYLSLDFMHNGYLAVGTVLSLT
jgi:hypothetical protein